MRREHEKNLHVLRTSAEALPRVALCLGLLGAAGALERSHRRAAPTAVGSLSRPRAGTRGWLPVPGRCAGSGQVCVSDHTCGTSRCEDPSGAVGALGPYLHARGSDVSILPSVAWNGGGYGVAWVGLEDEEVLDLWFARVDAEGRKVGSAVRLTRSPSVKLFPRLAWTSQGYGVVWTDIAEDDVSVQLQRVSPEGAAVGRPERLSASGAMGLGGDVVWNGRELGVSWYHVGTDGGLSLRLARVRPSGGREGPDRTVSQGFLATGLAGLAWNGDGYGLAWSTFIPRDEKAQTLFAFAGASGEARPSYRLGTTDGMNGAAAVAWGGRHFGVVWENDVQVEDEEEPSSQLMHAGAGPSSVAVAPRAVTGRDALMLGPSLASAGEGYGVAFAHLNTRGGEVRFARFNGQGVAAGPARTVVGGPLALMPSLSWSGREFGLAYCELTRDRLVVAFRRLASDGQRVGGDVVLSSE
ncbi:MAG: hypothetical protein HY909_24655 [Deltaproteobacteria bacterium]|nr:hypothetical protein [Deltaproteobacteria bacterium]